VTTRNSSRIPKNPYVSLAVREPTQWHWIGVCLQASGGRSYAWALRCHCLETAKAFGPLGQENGYLMRSNRMIVTGWSGSIFR